ncbi:MAG: hypothetical protein R2795_07345 [Saprospiraceae bacterium]
MINFSYGVQLPAADMKERFEHNFSAELSADYFMPSNWFFGLNGQYLFGSTVKEDVLAGLRTEAGYVIGNDRTPADVQLRERGMYAGIRVGKLIGLLADNERSGLRLSVGVGFLQHRIRIQDDPFRVVPQLEGEYEKGYDRLTNGLALYQFIGYQHIAKNNGMHLTAGFESIQGFTQNRRSFDFDTRQADTTQRLDWLNGFRVTFSMPIFIGNADEIFY